MALVYSYIRFSSKKQMEGESFRRQVEMGEEWIRAHGHTPASLTLHDLGVSAFRGKNKHSGALRTFLDAIQSGAVKSGMILLVENLDRLSRQGMRQAQKLFESILEAGVKIAVLKPQEAVYTAESIGDLLCRKDLRSSSFCGSVRPSALRDGGIRPSCRRCCLTAPCWASIRRA